MKKQLIALTVGAGLALPGVAGAVEVAGKLLDIYGKAHISLDAVNATRTTGDKANNLDLSSNSSRIGFKGEGPVRSMTGFYKIEASINFDRSGGALDHRAAYAGLKGGAGSFMVGYRDTFLKDVRGKFDLFGDSVGDARNIIGSIDGKNYFDVRAKNALMYSTPKAGGFQANVMHSLAWENNTTNQMGQDNNNDGLTSLNLLYGSKTLKLAAAWEQQDHVDATTGDTKDKSSDARLVGTYDFGMGRVGLIYEKMDDDNSAALRRSAYGANVAFKAAGGKIKLQYVKAGNTDAVSSSGANEVAVGYDYTLDKYSSMYVAYSKVSNETNASYLMGNGHDNTYTTAPGKNVSALSLGYVFHF